MSKRPDPAKLARMTALNIREWMRAGPIWPPDYEAFLDSVADLIARDPQLARKIGLAMQEGMAEPIDAAED